MLTGKLFLIVDDERELRQLIQEELESVDAAVLGAENGVQALKIIESRAIDLVLSDVRMPGGDGLALLKEITKRGLAKPVLLFMTGYSSVSLAEAYDLGAIGMLSKPFDFELLLRELERLVLSPSEAWSKPAQTSIQPECEIKLKVRDVEALLSANSIKFGRGGAFVPLSKEFPQVGTEISLGFDFEDGSTGWAGRGIVRWVRSRPHDGRQSGFGIEFLNWSQPALSRLLEYLERVRPVAYIPIG